MIVYATLVAVPALAEQSVVSAQMPVAAHFLRHLAAPVAGIIEPPHWGRRHWRRGFQNFVSIASGLTPVSSHPAHVLQTICQVGPEFLAYHRCDPARGLPGPFRPAFEEVMLRRLPGRLVGLAMTFGTVRSPEVSLPEALDNGTEADWSLRGWASSCQAAIISMGPLVRVQRVATSTLARSAEHLYSPSECSPSVLAGSVLSAPAASRLAASLSFPALQAPWSLASFLTRRPPSP
mmetsp:Transcript_52141/g.114446  ORF Transcript_52141/g.114446 Transcript_52141/m.114446 type:complete len:235 (-) Transcript_52141:1149-1853(-)